MVAAGVLAALAVAGKQSFLAAGVACVLHVALHRPRDLPAFLAAGAAVGPGLGAAATAWFGRDFWFAVTIPLTDYPRDVESYWVHWQMMVAQPLVRFVFAAAASRRSPRSCGAAGASRIWRRPTSSTPPSPGRCRTRSVTGVGAENHNLIEPMLATLALDRRRGASSTRRGPLPDRLASTPPASPRSPPPRSSRSGAADPSLYSTPTRARTERYVTSAPRPTAARWSAPGSRTAACWNLKNSQVPHDFAGDFTLNDVWMYVTVSGTRGPRSVDRLVQAIDRRTFDAILDLTGRGDRRSTTSATAVVAHHPRRLRNYASRTTASEVNVLTRRASPAS